MNERQMQRQGDVLHIPTTEPTGTMQPIPLEDGRVVLARGEATGHAHVIEGRGADFVLNALTLERYVHVREPATVRHEEHGALQLPSGWYEVRIQREYERGAVRNVAD